MVCRRKVYVTPKSYLDLISGLALAKSGEKMESWELGPRRNHPYECFEKFVQQKPNQKLPGGVVAFWSYTAAQIIPQVFT